ncbi:MAG: NADH-quinone oxidoreductase subunit NuoK [Candidatus Midichloria mitochondrii]|uniref:NADH-quinone oxidoreductase subunit K n=1 Tax=Midichloria mitochondrii (strain IricVA) TaxID=696127 RepID=F7XUT6_MIDMI|nr:NADH-quinone oxidoreductase subunit NuoK [Candidatus Midichloria mitochondrii]AEI88435.1 NADH:ubiquinone oxidoreductase subunit K [Candidatus Midichloria mitochondrii IricVA]MDJ1256191.1 NADH-quinone oxidoreductase subunit NuoK [Candidatus Midichloria mitochondrii]MDJ1287865.1 NADH-quinone oxidoreductase subunit NuoK [Candidatus Midichloria mitochondrii]MDJ1298753.1 NADH-quinone oxidoreductase subunit NuoK [Candidatus Midichloria mitochondrii]MDJ1312907.1 NADH-quinone oxidoreductase subunit
MNYSIVGDISIINYITVSGALFMIGACGILTNRQNMISILMSIELMLLAVSINFVAFSSYIGDLSGQIFTIFILTIAAAEAAIGLAIIMQFFRDKGTVEIGNANEMKG